MKLIADSGSTKTDWRLLTNDGFVEIQTQGINPYFQDQRSISSIVEHELLPSVEQPELVTEVYFYGAGCGSDTKNEKLQQVLSQYFKAHIVVQNDLMAAAKALCGGKAGLVAIIGTGANTCYYDGNEIIENIDPLGYLLGDEGSGAQLGKTFIQALLYDEVPKKLTERFDAEFNLSKEEILDAVYVQPLPNRFLASFGKFIHANLDDPFMKSVVESCFQRFFDKYICKYNNYQQLTLNAVGSIAYNFRPILEKIAAKNAVKIGTILKSPISGLMAYHQNKP